MRAWPYQEPVQGVALRLEVDVVLKDGVFVPPFPMLSRRSHQEGCQSWCKKIRKKGGRMT